MRDVKNVQKVMASAALAACLIVGTAVPAVAGDKFGYYTYPSKCQIEIKGFEHWGKAAASTRDHNTACYEIQAKVKYKDSANNFNWVEAKAVTSDYTRATSGWATDWNQAHGRSPDQSSNWRYISR